MRAPLRRPLLRVLAVALGVRLLALWGAASVPPLLDERTYWERAEDLLAGRGFTGSYQSWVRHPEGRPADLPQYPGAWQPPGQTVFLAGVMAVAGKSLGAARLAGVLLGTLTVGLVFGLGRAWLSERAGMAAAWMAALYPNLIAFTHYLWSETLFTFLLLLALWLLTRRPAPLSRRDALLGGAVLGLGSLTRATLFYFLPLLLAWLLWGDRSRVGLRRAALVAGMAVLVVLPWVVRNTLLHGGFVGLETNGPYNLWRGNGADSFADRNTPETDRYAWPFDSVPIAPVASRTARRLVDEAEAALGNAAPTDLEIARYAQRSAWAEIRREPAVFVARIPLRLWDMWNPTSFLLRHFRMHAYGRVPPLIEALVCSAAVASYLLVMGLAAVGCVLLRRRRETWLVLSFVAFFSAISAVSFGLTRFRLPLMPLLMLMAAPPLLACIDRARRRPAAVAAAGAALLVGCAPTRDPDPRPDILWVVWDTARADHLSLYGYGKPTTPRLDRWAQGARVFEDATSTAGYTVPSHASMFTGLMPSQHCVNNATPRLDDRFTTLAELLHGAGYRTFLYSANPQISAQERPNFAQGFEVELHPWSRGYLERALALVKDKVPREDHSSELPARLAAVQHGDEELTPWNVKAAGALAQEATLEWLGSLRGDRPWLVFLNYMEAHRPQIPARAYRERLMTPEQVERSYQVDRSWLRMWEYTFRLREFSDEELAVTAATYDATLAELDDLFASLTDALGSKGYLENAVVVLTSDHGEQLGEHHMLDHQYSLYQPLLRVPLVLWFPKRIEPGRDPRPVMNFDLFPTLLELAGVPVPNPGQSQARSLLDPDPARVRLAEETASSDVGITEVLAAHPAWDPSPFRRVLRALIAGRHKYLWGSDGRSSLYDLAADPLETRDLIRDDPATAERLHAQLAAAESGARTCPGAPEGAPPQLTPEARHLLESLGYAVPEAEGQPGR